MTWKSIKRKAREQPSRTVGKRLKVQNDDTTATNTACVQHPVLSVYYPRVVTLRQYFIQSLARDTNKYKRAIARLQNSDICLTYGSTNANHEELKAQIKQLLDTTVVGHADNVRHSQPVRANDLVQFSQQLQSSTNIKSTIATDREPDLRLQIEVVNFVIWLLFRNGRHQHLLTQGFTRASAPGAANDLPLTMAAGVPGVVCSYPNDHVATLTDSTWCSLLSCIGKGADLAMVELLLEGAIFMPVCSTNGTTSSNYYQLSGMPLSNIAMATKSLAQPKPNASVCRVQSKMITKSQGPQQAVLLSELRFVRHRMFYAKAALNAAGRVRLGLRHIHVLNRFSNVQDLEQTVHVAKYVFPRQFGLHNAFTSRVDSRETSQPFKDYTLREEEITAHDRISKKNKKWLPKRLRRAPIAFVQQLRERHARLNYVELLRKHCPDNQCCQCKQSTASGSMQLDGTPSRLVNPNRCSCSRSSVATSQVIRFVQSAVSNLVPVQHWGDAANYKTILRSIALFIAARKFESMTIHEVTQNIKIKMIPWLRLSTDSDGAISRSDFSKRQELFAEFAYWLLDSFVVPLIRTNFYVTESNADKNHMYFYRQDIWRHITDPAMQGLKNGILAEVKSHEAKRLLKCQSLAYGQVRLLPKRETFRPITNLRKRPEYLQNGRRLLGKSTNSLLAPAHKILGYEVSRRPRYLGSSLTSVGSIQKSLIEFKQRLDADGLSNLPLYFVKVDVQSCFDTIPAEQVLPLLEQLLSFDLYSVTNTAQVRAPKRMTRAKARLQLQPCVKFTTAGKAAKLVSKLSEEAQLALATAHGGTVFVGNTSVQTRSRHSIIDLLAEHLQSNLVRLGGKFYRQHTGIPQGSVLSSLLCNVFYGRLDDSILDFVKQPGTVLMRLVDDFLLITTAKRTAEKFLDVMHRGIPEFGIKVKPEKSLSNFSTHCLGTEVNALLGTQFPYCGVLINTSSLDITKEVDRLSHRGVVDSLSIEASSLPGKAFRTKSLNALRIQLHHFLFDTQSNSRQTVTQNLFVTINLAALRMLYYIRGLHHSKRPPSSVVLHTIDDMLKMTYRVLRRKAARADQQISCALSRPLMSLVGLNAFLNVLEARQTGYAAVIEWLHQEQRKISSKVCFGERKMLMTIIAEHEPIKRV